MAMRDRLAREDGVTLIELMVVVVLSGIVMGASLGTFEQFERTTGVNQLQNEAQEEVRAGLAGLSRELRNLASPTDQLPQAVVRAGTHDIVFQSVSSSATRRVRYCLSTTSRRLWRQVQFQPFTDPSTTSCPDSSWGAERAAVGNVTNGTGRPVFAYNATELTAITEITSTLWVDVNPGTSPAETALQTSIFLRNQNRAPVASFSAAVSGTRVVLNGAGSSDPESKGLQYFWYDAAETGNKCDALPDEVPQTGCVGVGIVFNYLPPLPGNRELWLVVRDPAGLTDSADDVTLCVPGVGVTCS
jgi:prepilin-type N-terminal cleavage/methylation domain-containing protein